ncbi:ataxin-7-like protein 3 isoform X2 [Frankliniella occidentalis]|uniref:SAGA-associated factor 11 homolog n=1 Tax=Frankliniella occidentalis TaxID=133901 RepID=A0A6J1SYE0_FRAOC|nr:ataxin-7-like protein 3 isoform X2 [Frankliniella occidentalis]
MLGTLATPISGKSPSLDPVPTLKCSRTVNQKTQPLPVGKMDAEVSDNNKKQPDMLSSEEVDALEGINRRFQELMSDPEILNEAANFLVEDLIDEMTIGIVFEVHRSAKLGVLDPEADMSGEDITKFKIIDDPGLDVFGQPPVIKKFQDCICPSCNRGLAASRFAPHLEKCMGMGRNSSRIASRRIANNSKETSAVVSEDEDDEWTIGGDRRRKKRDRSNGNAKKPSKSLKSDRRNGDSNSSFGGSVSESLGSSSGNNASFDASSAALEAKRPDERRTLLSNICGVISEHTRKLCTRSLRCPQHSDEQRRALRASVLVDETNFQSEIPEVQVNVESLGLDPDDLLSGLGGGVGSLGGLGMGSLSRGSWETERSNASSPADSVSVSSSTSSKKREKSSPGKSSNHKKKSKHSSSHEL